MPQIEISEETLKQLSEFGNFSRAASDFDLPPDQLADFLIQTGIDHMVALVLASLEADVLLSTVLQMGRQHPGQVYGSLVDVLLRGKKINEEELAKVREQMGRYMGFGPPPEKPET